MFQEANPFIISKLKAVWLLCLGVCLFLAGLYFENLYTPFKGAMIICGVFLTAQIFFSFMEKIMKFKIPRVIFTIR